MIFTDVDRATRAFKPPLHPNGASIGFRRKSHERGPVEVMLGPGVNGSGARVSGRRIRYGCCIALGGTKSFQDITVNNCVVRAVAGMAESLLFSSSMVVDHVPFCIAICFTLLLANESLTTVCCVAHFTTVSTHNGTS